MKHCQENSQELQALKHQLAESAKRYQFVAENSKSIIWDYIFKERCIVQASNKLACFGFGKIVYNVPKTLIDAGFINQISVDAVFEMDKRLHAGEQDVTQTLLVRNCENTGWIWQRFQFKTSYNDEGRPISAVCVATDITQEVNQQTKYDKEQLVLQQWQDSEMFVCKVNVSKGIIEEFSDRYDSILIKHEVVPYLENLNMFVKLIPSFESRKKVLNIMLPENLVSNFYMGNYKKTFEFQAYSQQGTLIWISIDIKMCKNPCTGNIMAFCYAKDITYEKNSKAVISRVLKAEYDYIMCIELENGSYTLFSENEHLLWKKTGMYNQDRNKIIACLYTPIGESDKCLRATCLKNVCKQLETQDVYSVYLCAFENGKQRYKKLTFSYMDKDKKTIILTRSDITGINEQEYKRNILLEQALTQAKKAHDAKIEFVKKLNEFIAIPTNTIIGISIMAQQTLNDKELTVRYIQKAQAAAKYLQNVVNNFYRLIYFQNEDIRLQSKPINLYDIFAEISAECYPQAVLAQVSYNVLISNSISNCFLADEEILRTMVQALISNAIYITETGGEVLVYVKPSNQTAKHTTVQFFIEISNCKYTQKQLAELLDFTGLNSELANFDSNNISLNFALCKCMAQHINAVIKGECVGKNGAIMQLEIPLKNSKQFAVEKPLKGAVPLQVMVVEEEKRVAEGCILKLNKLGIKADCVCDGEKAIQRVLVKQKADKCYDAIFVCANNCLQSKASTAVELRKIADTKTAIIVKVHDICTEFETVKNAKADIIMQKPVSFTALNLALKQVCEKTFLNKCNLYDEYNFENKRVLVAENNLSSQEITKMLLHINSCNAEITTNGVSFLEKFNLMPTGYYNAIILQNDLSKLDGIQVVKHVRMADQSVPIIFVTNQLDALSKQKISKLGVNDFIEKPFTEKEFYEHLEKVLNIK